MSGRRFHGCTPWDGSIARCFMRGRSFGALRCGYAYSGWICCSGFMRIGAIMAQLAVRGIVVVVVIVDFTGIALRDFFDRLAFLFQLSHVTFERGFEFALSTAKLGDRFSDRLAQLRQFLG